MKPDLIILHGAIGSIRQFRKLAGLLSDRFTVHQFNFEGHGGLATDQDFSIELFSKNLNDYVDRNGLLEPFVFGYSMGGYVALNSSAEGLRLGKIMTLGTKFEWTPEGAQREIKLLNPTVIEEKIPKFASYQNSLHEPLDWKNVMKKTADMMIRLGDDPVLKSSKLNSIPNQVLCSVGLKDSMVSLAETNHTVDNLQNGEIFTFPDFEHPIEKVDLDILTSKIFAFFAPEI